MFKRSISWFILVFTLLEFVVRTQLTAYDNSHGFISNNHDRFLANEISSMQEELASDIRSATLNKLSIKMQLKFDPEFLDFKQRPLGMPHLEKVTLYNIDRNRSIDMTSISGNTVHFHSSFFEDKKIPPLGNTTFRVVFLGREEGAVESNLFIHTTEGHFKYHVKGASIYSPYRLRPIVGVKLPVNAFFSPLIYLYNPHLEPIQIVEIYSSGGDFHLELPSGELEGPKDIWEIPPLQTKAVIKVCFLAKVEQNHTAFVRIKLNNTNDYLVVPLEVEVTQQAMLFPPQAYVDFGVGGSLDPEKEVALNLSNPFKKSIKIHSITTTSKAIKIIYDNAKLSSSKKADAESAEVAILKLNWKTAFETSDFSGKIVIKYKNSKIKTEIPYYISVVEGGLSVNTSTTRYFISDKSDKGGNVRKINVRNDFLTPIMLINVTLSEEAQKFFHISNFMSQVLKEREEKVVFNLKMNPGVNLADLKLNTHIHVVTNVSNFQFPLVTYNGKFDLKLPYRSKDNSLDLGLVSTDSRKDTYILLVNNNPVSIAVKQLLTSLSSSSVEILGCGKGDLDRALLQDTYKNITKCMSVKSGEYAVLKLIVRTGRIEMQIWGDITVHTQYELLSIPMHFKVAHGKLEIGPDRLVFDQCFPGKICSHPLRVHSTFSDPMVIEEILNIPPDSRITSKHSGHITARATKIIGHLYLDPTMHCMNECYLGFNEEHMANWWKTWTLTRATTEFDLNLVNTLYNRYLNQTWNGLKRWQNLTMRLDTSEVKGHMFKTRVKMSWPSLLLDQTFENKTSYVFPLTQVGNITYRNITLKNPSSYDLFIQVIIDQFYPNFDVLFEGLPPVFVSPGVTKRSKHGFFLETEMASTCDSDMLMQETSMNIRLKPNENYSFRIGFKALDATSNSGFVFLRNNLTVLEVLHLSGKGAFPNFKFGNRKPGSSQALVFELTDKHLKECEWEKGKRFSLSALTIKRSFTARNTGDIPVYINAYYINLLPCEGYGFKVLNCEPVVLPPNGTKKIDIAFTPDFTLAKITRTLILRTSLNYPVNYTLVTTVPSYYLAICSNIIPRPSWERILYCVCWISMVLLLAFVVVMPIVESEHILKDTIGAPRQNNTQHTLNLKLIGAQTRSEMHVNKAETESQPKKIENVPKLEEAKQEKYTAVIPATGKSKKKCPKRTDVQERENRRKCWLEMQKHKHEERGLKKSPQPKKVEEPKVVYEEETSSTTTESSSNNEDVEKHHKKECNKVIKPCSSSSSSKSDLAKEEPQQHTKLERKKSFPKSNKVLGNVNNNNGKLPEKNETAIKQNTELKVKTGKKDKKDKQKDSSSINKKVTVPKPVENPSPTLHVSGVVINSSGNNSNANNTTSSIWGENKASFSDVVARSDSANQNSVLTVVAKSPTGIGSTQATKPTMYVEPYKQPATGLGPIGPRKHDLWQDFTSTTAQTDTNVASFDSFCTEALAAESSQAFLDIDNTRDPWPSRITNSSYFNPSHSVTNGNNNSLLQDSWMMPQNNVRSTNNHWSNFGGSDVQNNNSGYLWGTSSVWQWNPPEPPRTPTRTPPGFPPHREDEESQRQQQQTNTMSYDNPFNISSIWTQHRNSWNYPQEQ
ncbi:PREDICTED: transmembrane protein 131 [Nicrophorus vespilloides]|uniref:Transmembrane protein 131 n=1 Tax=Nicrophorus vespilloides TaxID=110193 RepID=A0ABM1NA95_NICVS|nr:PREDICTED: transmembrane protein 131 [Nicrophorus vespilloides]